ncbi:MAG: hypothetical protein GXO81_03700 [Chlorobi bacterium]|nr:hypothetical protein [Chlorobiota bacterium]
MSKRIGLTAILLLFLLAVSAQKRLNYSEVDKKSYELFQHQKWAELLSFCAEARSQGIDFFYLQARTGIAYYNLKKYRKASGWFLKAWGNDRNFEWLQEYLYYSLVFSGRSSEAIKFASGFTGPVKKRIGFSGSKLTRLAVEGGYSFNPDFDKLTNAAFGEVANVGEDYGEAFYLKNYHFESFDLSHRLTPGISVNHNFTYISVNREEQVDWGAQSSFPIKIKQYQYFLNPLFVVGKKLYVSPSVNFVWGDSELFQGGLDSNSGKYFYSAPLKYSDLIFSTAVWSHFGNLSPGAEVNLATINKKDFMQFSAWVTFYPFSNTSFYLIPRVYFKAAQATGFGYNTFGVSGGAQLGQVHVYGQYLNGDMENFIESAGYVIANFPGHSSQKFSASFYFPEGKKYQFVLRYINQDVTESYQVYTGGVKSNSIKYDKYIKHTLTCGISWNF